MLRSLCASLFILPLLAGCGAGHAPAPDQAQMELRIYHVPPEKTDAVRIALVQSLDTGEKNRFGNVSTPAPGELLVLAPASLQSSIGATLEYLARPAQSSKTAPAQMQLQFWSVDALAGAGADDASLSTISAALGEARKSLGEVHFVLNDHVGAVSGIGIQWVKKSWLVQSAGKSSDHAKQIEYRITGARDALSLEISYHDQLPVADGEAQERYRVSETDMTVPIRPGQTLVLSQGPVPTESNEGKPLAATTRLYLVRVDPVPTT
jgi:hypothetical protein